MTKAQEKAIAKIRALVEKDFYADDIEFKQWEIKEFDTFVSLIVVTGHKNDEGTMAEVFCRDRAHLFIGKRGGITYPVHNNGKHYYKRFKGYSILQAVCDQKI